MHTKIINIDMISSNDMKKIFNKHYPIPFPTETVFGFGAPFDDEKTIEQVFLIKGRPRNNPLIVHIADLHDIDMLVEYVPDEAKKLMEKYFPGPLTIVLKKSTLVTDIITAGQQTVAIRMPSDEIARAFITKVGKPVVAPSANLSGKPSATTAQHVYEDFKGKIPYIIDGKSAHVGIESTIIDMSKKPYHILRPGAITQNMIQDVLGDVFGSKMSSQVIAPGMIHPHYQPKHPLQVLEGSSKAIIAFMKTKKNALFIGHEVFIKNIHPMISLGETIESARMKLYDAFRQSDDMSYVSIYIQSYDDEALMNRILKAANGSVLKL